MVTSNKRTNNRAILVQACSWPVRKQSNEKVLKVVAMPLCATLCQVWLLTSKVWQFHLLRWRRRRCQKELLTTSQLWGMCVILERIKRVIDCLSLLTWSPHPWHSFSCRVFYLSHKYHPCPHHGKRKLEQEITTGWKEERLKGLLLQIWLNY